MQFQLSEEGPDRVAPLGKRKLVVGHRVLRPRHVFAACELLPRGAKLSFFRGSAHANELLVECKWDPSQGALAGQWLRQWLGLEHLESSKLDVVLTLMSRGARWRALSVVQESFALPGQYGFFAARPCAGGEELGSMLDGLLCCRGDPDGPRFLEALAHAKVEGDGFAFSLPSGSRFWALYDGRACRHGGPKRANDAHDLGLANNCALYEDGLFCVLPFSDVPMLRADGSDSQRRRSELFWSYGDGYW